MNEERVSIIKEKNGEYLVSTNDCKIGEKLKLDRVDKYVCLMILEKSSHLIDLVLLDLVMPGIDGFEVLRRRQTMDAFKDINFCRCI